MGAVWRAHDEQLGREVAVKELRLPEHLRAEERANWIARLDREARAAARLKHPGIVTVHDRTAGADGRPWIVMEWVTGGSLDDLLQKQGPLSPQHVADIGRQVAAALRAAHRMGITHRDIKPANILLEDGRAVLTDFGIAALEGDATLTATGMIMGTPAFMAPEQVRGLPATAASDLWSLGATLYTAVEGHPPFAGSAPSAVLVAVATEEPAPAVQAGSLAPALEGLLRKEPAARLTMEQLQAQLDQVATPGPVAGPPPPLPAHASPAAWPTAPAQPPVASPGAPPAHPANWPGQPAGTPVVARRRISRRTAWISAAALALVASATAYGLYATLGGKTGNDAYQDNLRAAEGMGRPAGFSVAAKARADGDRARVTYVGGRSDPDDSNQGAGTAPRAAASAWMNALPGISHHQLAMTPGCMTKTNGCTWTVTSKDGYTEPTIVQAQIHTQNGRFALQIEVGPVAE